MSILPCRQSKSSIPVQQVSVVNPMLGPSTGSTAVQIDTVPRKKATVCSLLHMVILGGGILIGVVVAVVVFVAICSNRHGSGNSAVATQSAPSFSAADLAVDACPGNGTNALLAGEYAHYVQVEHSFLGSPPNCSLTEAMNQAAARLTSTSPDAILTRITSANTNNRALSGQLSVEKARSLRGQGHAWQVFMTTSEEAALELEKAVLSGVSNGDFVRVFSDAIPFLALEAPPANAELVTRGRIEAGS